MVLLRLDDENERPPRRLEPIEKSAGLRRSATSAALPIPAQKKGQKTSSQSVPAMKRSASSAAILPKLDQPPDLPSLPPSLTALPPSSTQNVRFAPAEPSVPTRGPPGRGLQRQYTGVGMAPAYSRKDVFDQHSVVVLDAIPSPDAQFRKERLAKQRAARAERPAKNRGAWAHAPLRSEMHPGTTRPARIADAADAFDRLHHQRWDRAEGMLFALQRDLTHISKQNAFSFAAMEVSMSRFKEPSDLEGVQRFAIRQKKAKPKKPWKLETSIWGARRVAAREACTPHPTTPAD